jgi:hypothetical protein
LKPWIGNWFDRLKYVNDVTYYQSCVTLIMAGSLTLHDDKKSIGKNHDFISYNIFSFCLPGTSLLSAAPSTQPPVFSRRPVV